MRAVGAMPANATSPRRTRAGRRPRGGSDRATAARARTTLSACVSATPLTLTAPAALRSCPDEPSYVGVAATRARP
jgi:hypothetical protein